MALPLIVFIKICHYRTFLYILIKMLSLLFTVCAQWNELTFNGSTQRWRDVSISGTGQYITGVVIDGNIWNSDDYGQTWSEVVAGESQEWRSIEMSNNGSLRIALPLNGTIWRSDDYGITWTSILPVNEWTSSSMSFDGQYHIATAYERQFATSYDGGVFRSDDYGLNWAEITVEPPSLELDWWNVVSSSMKTHQKKILV